MRVLRLLGAGRSAFDRMQGRKFALRLGRANAVVCDVAWPAKRYQFVDQSWLPEKSRVSAFPTWATAAADAVLVHQRPA